MSTPDFAEPEAKPLGLIAALAEEAAGLFEEMAKDPHFHVVQIGGRDYHVGSLWGQPCVLTLARIGKVAAATTATAMLHQFDVGGIVFTGVAGGIGRNVKVGDVVLAENLLQHDLDASPIFPRYEVPLMGMSHFPAHTGLSERLATAVETFLEEDFPRFPERSRTTFGLVKPVMHHGLIASGDKFINGGEAVAVLRQDLPELLAIEMEGAAVAQVCHDYGVPFAVLRTVSDAADDAAHIDFAAFLKEIASHYSYGIIKRFLAAPLP
jgi:adenosylhomocysteine nucleosidase